MPALAAVHEYAGAVTAPRPGIAMNVQPSAQRRSQGLSITRSISARQDEVWDVISAPGHLELVHPFCESNVVFEWPGEAAVDQIRYRSGWVYDRHFKKWIDGVGYDLEIGAANESTSRVSWRLEQKDGDVTNLTISLWPRVIVDVPGFRGLVRWGVVGPMMRRYLRSVTAGVDWFVIHRTPVRADQFGFHPWFSSKRRSRV